MIFIISMNLDNTNLLADMHLTGFEPIIAKNVQKINFKFTMISIFTTLYFTYFDWFCCKISPSNINISENTDNSGKTTHNTVYSDNHTMISDIGTNNTYISVYSTNSAMCTTCTNPMCSTLQHIAAV